MVIGDLDVRGPLVRPDETDTVQSVDPNAVLAGAVPFQLFQAVPGRNSKLLEIVHPFYLVELSLGDIPEIHRQPSACPFADVVVENRLCLRIPKRYDHRPASLLKELPLHSQPITHPVISAESVTLSPPLIRLSQRRAESGCDGMRSDSLIVTPLPCRSGLGDRARQRLPGCPLRLAGTAQSPGPDGRECIGSS